jgi:predicted metal-dependent HD superfamily phosphohydrolase
MVIPDHMTFLSKEWNWVMDARSVPVGEPRHSTFAQIVTAYSEPHRHYHNLDHIRAMLADPIIDVIELGPSNFNDLTSLRLAIWYHDIVYDPRSTENEHRSAEVARMSLVELGLGLDHIRRVCELILMTREHDAPEDDWTAAVFLDLDLSILATQAKTYNAYATAIRQEYAWVDERDYCLGRRGILKSFLDKPAIFRTDWFQKSENEARINIVAEIAQIDAILRTLP